MTDRLAEIEARCEKATEGPWETEVNLPYNRHPSVFGGHRHRDQAIMHIAEVGNAQAERQDQWEADALFIAASRTDMPWLLAQLRAARADVERLTERCGIYQSQVEAGAKRIEAAERLVYVPGVWRCPKCNFRLVQSNLNANTGTVTARDEPGDKCPNCASPLWRCSWKIEAQENLTIGEQQVARAVAAEARVRGHQSECDEVEQILGKALGYPWYKDDQKNFPNSTEADGVCVGEHVPSSIAMEAANRIRAAEARAEKMRAALELAEAAIDDCQSWRSHNHHKELSAVRAALAADTGERQP